MEIKKALTFRASSIGDCLMGKYLLENIHEQFPEARLAIVVGSRAAMIRDLFAAYPWLEIIEANRRNPVSIYRLFIKWRKSDFVLTQYAGKPGARFSLGSKIMGRLISRRGGFIGFKDASRVNKWLYDTVLPYSMRIAPAEAERSALTSRGISIAHARPLMKFLTQLGLEKEFNISDKKIIIIHLFSGGKGRGLSPEKKRDLLSSVVRDFPNFTLLISGSPDDAKEAEDAARGLSITNMAGKVSLQEFMNLIARSAGVISVDSGVAHLAAQLQKPLIVLATCLGPNWWRKEQYGENSATFFSRVDMCEKGHIFQHFPLCLNTIDAESVVQTGRELF